MDWDRVKTEVKQHYSEYLTPARRMIGGKPSYVCPKCQNGTGSDGTGIQPDPRGDGYTLHCFKCGWHGDVIDAYRIETGCDFSTAVRELADRFGVDTDDDGARTKARSTSRAQQSTAARGKSSPSGQAPAPKQDFGAYLEACHAALDDDRAVAYLASRGLSLETARDYGLGFDKSGPYLVIPASRHYYTARAISPDVKPRFKNPTGAPVELFNAAALEADEGIVFVTEAAIDALSIIEVGHAAVGLNSASNTRLLLSEVAKRKPTAVLALALDNDAAGRSATSALAKSLEEEGVPYIVASPYGSAKDANEALVSDRAKFAAAIDDACAAALKPDTVGAFMNNDMMGEMAALRQQAGRKTGFDNLDHEAGSIYNGLYVIGGISSVGKTSFMAQVCDQMAEEGNDVLFFSLEQSRLEVVSKSISRRTALRAIRRGDLSEAVSGLDVRMGNMTPIMVDAIEAHLQSVGDKVSIIEGNFDCTVSRIRSYTERYIRLNKVKPIVIIDYLQVLQPDVDPDTGRKPTDKRQAIDQSVTALKRMSRSLELPIFVVSSVNRSNYLTPIDFESFKESGGIEYTADVVWGLQLTAVNDELFADEDKNKVKRRERLAEAKDAIPRDVELVCLKNRYGRARYRARFTYYPQYDLFRTSTY